MRKQNVLAMVLAGSAALLMLSGCGGGCHDIWCAGPILEMRWQSDNYTFTTPTSSAEVAVFDTAIEVSGYGAFDGLKLNITHGDWGPNPVTSPYATVRLDQVSGKFIAPVQFLVYAAGGAGSYPKGTYTVTASSGYESVAPISTTIVLQ